MTNSVRGEFVSSASSVGRRCKSYALYTAGIVGGYIPFGAILGPETALSPYGPLTYTAFLGYAYLLLNESAKRHVRKLYTRQTVNRQDLT